MFLLMQGPHGMSMQLVVHWGSIIWRSHMDFFIRDSMQPDAMSGIILHADSLNWARHFDIIIMQSLIGFIIPASMHFESEHDDSMHFEFMHMLSMPLDIIIMQVLMDAIMAESIHFDSIPLGIMVMHSHMDFIMGAIICIMPMGAISMHRVM